MKHKLNPVPIENLLKGFPCDELQPRKIGPRYNEPPVRYSEGPVQLGGNSGDGKPNFVGKNYAGYRVIWVVGEGFKVFEDEGIPTPTLVPFGSSLSPKEERIVRFKNDVLKACETDSEIAEFAGQYKTQMGL